MESTWARDAGKNAPIFQNRHACAQKSKRQKIGRHRFEEEEEEETLYIRGRMEEEQCVRENKDPTRKEFVRKQIEEQRYRDSTVWGGVW